MSTPSDGRQFYWRGAAEKPAAHLRNAGESVVQFFSWCWEGGRWYHAALALLVGLPLAVLGIGVLMWLLAWAIWAIEQLPWPLLGGLSR